MRRVLARSLDFGILGFILSIIFITIILWYYPGMDLNKLFLESNANTNKFISINIILSIPIFSIITARFGNTPGKKLFGLTVVNNENTKPKFLKLLFREIVLYICVFSGIMIIQHILSYIFLRNTNISPWDKFTKTKVTYSPITKFRLLTFSFILLIPYMIGSWEILQMIIFLINSMQNIGILKSLLIIIFGYA